MNPSTNTQTTISTHPEALTGSTPSGWQIDPAHAHLCFEVDHLGLTKTPGFFRSFETTLHLDDENIEASRVAIVIDAASVDTGFELRDESLRGPEWFDVKTHAKLTFESTSVQRVGANQYLILGDLNVRGNTAPVSFHTTLTNRAFNPWLNSHAIGFVGFARVNRSSFGMAGYPLAISDVIELKISVEALKKI